MRGFIITVLGFFFAAWIAAQAWAAPPAMPTVARPSRGVPRQFRAQTGRDLTPPRHAGSDRYSFGFILQWVCLLHEGGPEGLATDGEGNVYALTDGGVFKYTSMGTLLAHWGSMGEAPGQFACGGGIAVDDSGNVYTTDPCLSRIQRFSKTGAFLAQWGGPEGDPAPYDFFGAIAVDDGGNVYVAETGGSRVQKFTCTGTYLTQWGGPGTEDGEFGYPAGIAVDHCGHVYVLDGADGRIQKFTSGGEHLATWGSVPGTGLAAGAGGVLYVVDGSAAQVAELDSNGVESRRWGGFGHGDGQFQYPFAVAADPFGGVYVLDQDDRRIQRFGMATRWLVRAASGPNGSIHPSGDVYVAEGMNQSYSIVPDLGYRVADVDVDGSPAGPPARYTFTDVRADHTIDARFTVLDGWPDDALLNLPVCTAPGWQRSPQIASDGAHGALMAWSELRYEDDVGMHSVHAQRIDTRGVPQWSGAGTAVCTTSTLGRYLQSVVSDGAGGAIVLWRRFTSSNHSDLHAQRLDPAGVAQWPEGGVPICPGVRGQAYGALVADGAGGAIVAWTDDVSGQREGVFVQRIDAVGTPRWGGEGVRLSALTSTWDVALVPDGAGGAIVVWGRHSRLYAQRVTATGDATWTSEGVPVSTRYTCQFEHAVVADGVGGVIVAWVDAPDYQGDNRDIYVQRIGAGGVALWGAAGRALCTAAGDQEPLCIASDGDGGAIVAWDDWRDAGDVYARRVSAAGTPLWDADGVPLGAAAGVQCRSMIAPDGEGGAIVAWIDMRRDAYDIYAQSVSPGGLTRWAPDGVALCTAAGGRWSPTITSDGGGGAVLAWDDYRNWDEDIYAQRVDRHGALGGAATSGVPAGAATAFALDPVHPNPLAGGRLTVHFTLTSPAAASVELLDVAGRRVASREAGSLGIGRHAIDLVDHTRLHPGLYFVRLVQGRDVRTTRVVVLR